jgi:hypothetical protein
VRVQIPPSAPFVFPFFINHLRLFLSKNGSAQKPQQDFSEKTTPLQEEYGGSSPSFGGCKKDDLYGMFGRFI